MKIIIHPNSLVLKFLIIIGLLLLANIAGLAAKFCCGIYHVYGLGPLVDFNTEQNIPSFYSACTLLFCSLLLYSIAMQHKSKMQPFFGWLGLSVIFLFLSIDEIGSVHELLVEPVKSHFGTSGMLFYAWVIPYGIALLCLAALYARFLLRLPRRTMFLFVSGGVVFVLGAIGLELFGGKIHDDIGISGSIAHVLSGDALRFAIFYTIEELLEMIGVVIFIYGLLTYIVDELGTLKIKMRHPKTQQP